MVGLALATVGSWGVNPCREHLPVSAFQITIINNKVKMLAIPALPIVLNREPACRSFTLVMLVTLKTKEIFLIPISWIGFINSC